MTAKRNPIDNLKPYKPGQSGNPSGKPGLPKEVRKAKNTNRITLEKTLNEFLTLDREELQKRLQNPKATMLELAVGTIVAKAAKDGDQIRLNFILDRLLGKVAEKVEQKIGALDNPEEYEEIPKEALIKLVSGEK